MTPEQKAKLEERAQKQREALKKIAERERKARRK